MADGFLGESNKEKQKLPLKLIAPANLRHLDITKTPKLKELPPHVVNLKFLRKLSKFIVSEDDGLCLRELTKPYHLSGSITILGLDKVMDVHDATMINLKDKKNVEELVLEWEDRDNVENEESQTQVPNLLQPHNRLRMLVVEGYGGLTFPKWIGDSSYSKLVKLCLFNCKTCKSLPSLGELPLLEKREITRMLEIERVGAELYGEASSLGGPFRSLKTLEFQRMPKWVNWSCPVCITSLLHLRIEHCPELVVPVLAMSPSLQKLSFENVKDFEHGLCLSESFCPNLTFLNIDRCESIESFPETGLPTPNLRNLHIKDCQNLKYLPSNLQNLTSLRLVYAWGCGNLVTLPEMGLPPSLEYLGFGDCEKVEKQMWDEWSLDKFPFLEHFSIKGGFRDAVCFPPQESQSLLPPALASLHIIDLSNLESLSSAVFLNLTSLTELGIMDCPKLQSLPMEALPPIAFEIMCHGLSRARAEVRRGRRVLAPLIPPPRR